jgi:hypothetical protein
MPTFTVTDYADLPADYLIELGSSPIPVAVGEASLGQPGTHAVGASPDTPAPTGGAVVLRYSLRGWIGEPGDALQPNVPYPRRLIEPPTLVRAIRVLPEDSARASFQSGEIRLDNTDGALDQVMGDWTMVGRPATLRRGPHRQPLRGAYSEFVPVAELRITSAALSASGRVSIGLREAATDLAVPVSTPYAGTGGAEGDSNLTGQLRPVLMGLKRNLPVTALLASQLVYQVSGLPLAQILAVRDRGATLTAGPNYASLEALLVATVPQTTYATCYAAGVLRTGSPPAGQLTVDAQGAGDSSHAGIALALLTGPGGLSADRIDTASFAALPGGPAGFYWTGGTVEAALNEVMGSAAAWWNSDRLGRIVAGRLTPPENLAPAFALKSWMLTAEPSEVAGTAPRWRQRVAFRRVGLVQSATDLAGVAQSDPAVTAALSTAQLVATAFYAPIASTYPSAIDPAPLVTGFDQEADAQALANMLLNLHGVRRRRWQVPVGKWGMSIDVGQAGTIDHPKLAGRTWVVIASDEAGDSKTLTLWG